MHNAFIKQTNIYISREFEKLSEKLSLEINKTFSNTIFADN